MIRESVRLLVVLAVLSVAQVARADWKELSVAVTPAYAVAYVDSRTANGGGFATDVGLGLTDALSLHATGLVSWHDAPATKTQAAGAISAYSAMLGITYTLDVIRLVPAFNLSVGAVGLRGDTEFGATAGALAVMKPVDAFAISLGFLLDYLLTRHISVGVEVRYQALVTDLSRVPMYLYAGPRVGFRWQL